MQPIRLNNRKARHLWLWTNGLSETPVGPLDVMAIIRRLGFVQIDTIRNVTRAHNHILWTRNQNYREGMLWPLLGRERRLFEHFTHDASLLPVEMLPLWQRQFARLGARAARGPWYQSGLASAEIARLRERIAREGPLSTHAFETRAKSREMWARPPHKKALDQMWYAGDLATSHRENFVKFYDLGERVFPPHDALDDRDAVEALCDAALDRLGIATVGEVQRFWAAMDTDEARGWLGRRALAPVEVEGADGAWTAAHAPPDIEARLTSLPAPTSRLRILNPFDPAIRDRARLRRLFGFEYVNEMFVPAAKRRWGYYVYPLLEGDRFVGRVELKANRGEGWLRVTGFWPEAGVKWGAARRDRLDAELARFGRLAGIRDVAWTTPGPG
ncbi:winged helix-turn-helix domain-containing protein [Roseovarius spongiae]|uniref:Winged helix-turn-helix domain-containing protein n=1 Tax=Roseovarius spongiae TaxID=2320272 RepID=A0A3A8AWM0_9RHOB|nr:crosslink repair DNA glycosylase YcaQ family protein [Roseovarius spongiae]RKF14054.1 winged helix-turn-helix domain-containing protein [Roseovarius spongiae]